MSLRSVNTRAAADLHGSCNVGNGISLVRKTMLLRTQVSNQYSNGGLFAVQFRQTAGGARRLQPGCFDQCNFFVTAVNGCKAWRKTNG